MFYENADDYVGFKGLGKREVTREEKVEDNEEFEDSDDGIY